MRAPVEIFRESRVEVDRMIEVRAGDDLGRAIARTRYLGSIKADLFILGSGLAGRAVLAYGNALVLATAGKTMI